jgi:hypothetical protein
LEFLPIADYALVSVENLVLAGRDKCGYSVKHLCQFGSRFSVLGYCNDEIG